MQKNIATLEEKLEIKFKDINILKNAILNRVQNDIKIFGIANS